ncbi:hypothetical protein QBC41DRAFT_377779 [Cercophora samala]|uniref:Uncharacterized protein n=1 Tax=Cercophora samala TaxID=330535 RepID=A0AA39ZNJ5_9PEZI|nr:hypothetical protein QBC41DRAFT_377779 [Cercophora samala]
MSVSQMLSAPTLHRSGHRHINLPSVDNPDVNNKNIDQRCIANTHCNVCHLEFQKGEVVQISSRQREKRLQHLVEERLIPLFRGKAELPQELVAMIARYLIEDYALQNARDAAEEGAAKGHYAARIYLQKKVYARYFEYEGISYLKDLRNLEPDEDPKPDEVVVFDPEDYFGRVVEQEDTEGQEGARKEVSPYSSLGFAGGLHGFKVKSDGHRIRGFDDWYPGTRRFSPGVR